ncbi:MAG TPA: shikimate dehydrogenase [Spirochaetales bacterium]|nr:shikimate dehydrogenase [Spirochaetales bacterium]
MPNYKAELVGVFGHPVSENPTVVVQEAAFNALNLNWRYLTIEVLPEQLGDAIRGLRAFNMRGINLTIPHKIEVMQFLDSIAEDARLIGAVNTVINNGGNLHGENTDGKGFIRSLTEESHVSIPGKKVVVLGAGGAARAIAVELALRGAGEILVVNRSTERGEALVSSVINCSEAKSRYIPWSGILKIPYDTDILINATSIGLFPGVDDKPLIDYDTIRPEMVVCDVIPNPPRTAFLKEAEKRGAKTIDGLGMLVNQGAIGFKLWTGLDAPVDVMKRALAKEFGVA